MLTLRAGNDRGHAHFGWLDSHHTFSFGEYHDPAHMGFGPLRVINDDRVAGGAGFGTHGHADMEIISYVVAGALAHQDSLGNGSVLRRGDVQRMTAGTGVRHSEFNGSETEPVHFLQIWVVPERRGLTPGYEEAHIPDADKRAGWQVIASPHGREGGMVVHQDVTMRATIVPAGERRAIALPAERAGWLQVVAGQGVASGQPIQTGDGVALRGVDRLRLEAAHDLEVLLFEVPSASVGRAA